MLVNSPRPARMDMGCQSSALTKTPAVLQSRAARIRKRIALRRSVRDVMDVRPLGFVVKTCGLYSAGETKKESVWDSFFVLNYSFILIYWSLWVFDNKVLTLTKHTRASKMQMRQTKIL